nr:hypothetical protein [Candidatus Nanopelagicales bacterium]
MRRSLIAILTLCLATLATAQVVVNGLGSVFVNGRSTGYGIGEVTLLPSGAGLSFTAVLDDATG